MRKWVLRVFFATLAASLQQVAAGSSFSETKASLFPVRASGMKAPDPILSSTGVVISISRQGPHAWIVLSSPDAVIGITNQKNALADFRFGDILRVRGTVRSKYDEFCKAAVSDIVRIGHTNDVPTRPVSGMQIANGNTFGQCVACSGIVSSASTDAGNSDTAAVWNWITLWTDEGPVHAICPNDAYPIKDLRQLSGAVVSIKGVTLKMTEAGNPAAAFLQLFSSQGLAVITPPPSDPFATSDADAGVSNRRRVSGTVLAVSANGILLSGKPAHWQTLLLPNQVRPKPGQHVTAVGYLNPFARNTTLSDTVLKIDGDAVVAPTPAHRVSAEELFDGDSVNFEMRQTPVTITGKLPEPPVRIGGGTFVRLVCAGRTIDVDITQWQDKLRHDLEPGCTVEISGYILPVYGNGVEHPLASIEKLLFLLRTDDDIRVLDRPSWWTPVRLTVLLCLVLAVLLASVAWNLSLKSLSERRARTLYRERLAHVHTELKIQERTHLAVEIHDSLSQTLTGVALQIDAAIKANDLRREQATTHLSAARQLLASCRHELRCCIWDLRNRTFAEADLTEAIRRMLATHTENVRLSVRFSVPRQKLSESTTHAILRIVYELVSNAIRHGKASHIRIAGEFRNGLIRFSVADDGSGFDPLDHPGPLQGHFGLQGIQERLKRLNGEITLQSAPGRHTKATVSIPSQQEGPDTEKDSIS